MIETGLNFMGGGWIPLANECAFWFHSCEVGKNWLVCISSSVSIAYRTVRYWPSNKGQKYLQQVMHPWDVNCPMAVSTRNIGIPQASRKRTYGTKNAPRKGFVKGNLMTESYTCDACSQYCSQFREVLQLQKDFFLLFCFFLVQQLHVYSTLLMLFS